MAWLVTKYLITAAVVVLVSEVASIILIYVAVRLHLV